MSAIYAPWLAVALSLLQPPANLLTDADFEQAVAGPGLAAGWALFQNDGGAYTTSRVAGGHGGRQALRIAGTGSYGGVVSGRRPLSATHSYLGEAWLRVTGPGSAQVKLDFHQGERYLGSSTSGLLPPGPDWRPVRVADWRQEYPDADQVTFAVALEGAGELLVDDCGFWELPRAEQEAANLLQNGSAETGTATTPANFALHAAPNSQAVARWGPEAAHDGRCGLRLESPGEWAVWVHDPVALDRRRSYTLSGWVRVLSGRATLKFDYATLNGWVGQQVAEYPAADGQWTRVTLEALPDGYPAATIVAAVAMVEGAGSTAEFDSLVLTER
ncbi:MAG: hypothetical protein IT204_03005 [Fimbriimonadaceae bacterium]|nr:hypothetical protein [Fimbriimonadaceae bacterium]